MWAIVRLQNPIQEYAWGSLSAIPELLCRPNPSKRPQAELWMGAHPKSPSFAALEGKRTSLIELIRESPTDILGRRVAEKFSNRLPFLFKVLAASKPLSIQAHPSMNQAREGFARENALRIPYDSSSRNYRDENHKPEIICALEPFWALKGFRRAETILSSLQELRPSLLEREVSILAKQPNAGGLKQFFQTLLSNAPERNRRIVQELLEKAEHGSQYRQEARWMRRLQSDFPGDIGGLAPILLNLVSLGPGEALYLSAGELHAYLEGVGIELMANSDNVIRGGLTTKHIDISELMHVVSFEPGVAEILSPPRLPSGEKRYQTPAEEFRLTSIELRESKPFTSGLDRSVEILICLEGEAQIEAVSQNGTLELHRGDSVLIPAAVERYRLQGHASIFRADVPD